MSVRRILHVDMDAFYASVEQRDDPALRGRPLAVGGRPEGRGVVAAASYEARAFGVYSAMPMSRAVRLCPSLVIVPPDFSRYKAASNAVFAIFREVTKFLAKIASGWKKPDGLTVISPDRVEPFLQQLPVGALWGVGPVTEKKLKERGIERLVDVRSAEPQLLRETVGSLADWLRQLAHGIDDRPVTPNREVKSSGSENTYGQDLTSLETIRTEVAEMAARVVAWLTRREMRARTVTIKVRYDDFTTITRSHTAPPTRSESDLIARAVRLLEKTDAGTRPVRLLGVSVHNFCGEIEDEAADDPDRLPFE
jgi:DNA polymerase-4